MPGFGELDRLSARTPREVDPIIDDRGYVHDSIGQGAHYTDALDPAPSGPPWLQTLGSGYLNLISPEPAQIDWHTIAVVLSRVARFGGHTTLGPLSVAQHCMEGARAIQRDTGRSDFAAAFLSHDAHEAFIGDMPTPIRDALMAHAVLVTGDLAAADTVRAAVRSLKSALDAAIHKSAGVPWPLAPECRKVVEEYDLRMCLTERNARLSTPPIAWPAVYETAKPVEGVDLFAWDSRTVASLYAAACRELLPALSR